MLSHSVNARRNPRIAGVLVLILCLALCCVLAACGSSAKTVKPTGNGTGTDATSTTASASSKSAASTSSSGMHSDTKIYSVDLPAYWNDRVIVNAPDAYGTTLDVRSKKYPDYSLCTVEVVANEKEVLGGDIGKANVKTVRLSDGRVACLWAPNYGWLVASGSEKMTSAEAAELVDLSTGGKTVADCEKALKNGNNSVTTDWIAENVKVTAK